MTRTSGRFLGGRLAALVLAFVVGAVGPLHSDAFASSRGPADVALRQAACEFRLGFRALRDLIPDVVGQCLENERPDPSGDTVQRTTNGLLTYRAADNVVAFTDGSRTWLNGPNGLQSRSNGERFAWEPPAPGTTVIASGSGSGGTGRAAAQGTGRSASARPGAPPTAYVHEVIDEPPALGNGVWPCLKENPSCAREEWWAQWNELQDARPVQYGFLAPGFVTEYRFAEAVGLLWQWPEGRDLLRAGADHGVRVIVAPDIPRRAFAGYSPRARMIGFNEQFTETSTWMVASVLAHELKHAMDDWMGIRQGTSTEDCLGREQEAYKVEARFAKWLYAQQGAAPDPREVARTLSREDQQLFLNLHRIASAANPEALAAEDYRGICAPRR